MGGVEDHAVVGRSRFRLRLPNLACPHRAVLAAAAAAVATLAALTTLAAATAACAAACTPAAVPAARAAPATVAITLGVRRIRCADRRQGARPSYVVLRRRQ